MLVVASLKMITKVGLQTFTYLVSFLLQDISGLK